MKKAQSYSLFILRVLIGWHLLYEGLVKVFDPTWTSVGFLLESQWIFSGIFKAMAENQAILGAVDFANQWGLVLIGLALILGLFTRTSAILGMILILLYYFCTPPFNGFVYSMPTEGSYLIVNKNLVEAAALFLLSVFPAGKQFGLDRFITKKQKAG